MFLFFSVQFFRVYRSSNENVEKHRAFYQFVVNWQEKIHKLIYRFNWKIEHLSCLF